MCLVLPENEAGAYTEPLRRFTRHCGKYTAEIWMSAALIVPVDRETEWREELARILAAWTAMPTAARAAVRAVVTSLLSEPDISTAEAALVHELIDTF